MNSIRSLALTVALASSLAGAPANAGPIEQLLEINRTVGADNTAPVVPFGSGALMSLCAPTCSPWFSDGTSANTRQLVANETFGATKYAAAGSRAFILAGSSLYRTDGTSAGTTSFSLPSGGGAFGTLASLGSNLLVFTNDGTLWTTDGTTAGSVALTVTGTGSSHEIAVLGSYVYFASATPGVGVELWRTDGTSGGTSLFKDIRGGTDSSDPREFVVAGGRLYFTVAKDSSGARELWSTDGTDAGTVFVRDNGFASLPVVDHAGSAYFFARDFDGSTSIWRSDGTAAGTTLVKTLPDFLLVSDAPVSAGPYLYFAAYSGVTADLWRTDGTEIGTVRVSQVPNTTVSATFRLAAVGSTVFFSVHPSQFDTTASLWKTVGDLATTEMLMADGAPSPLGAIGTSLVLAGVSNEPAWITSDGTVAGMHALEAAPGEPSRTSYCVPGTAQLGAATLFFANDGTHGCELWKTDGTAAGTVLVKDIRPGPKGSIGYPGVSTTIVVAGTKAFFAANDGISGNELWATDGTEAGTYLVKDAEPGPGNIDPTELVALGNAVIYRAGTNGSAAGLEPWRSDGTPAGTYLIRDLRPTSSQSSDPRNFTVAGSNAFFTAVSPEGVGLWRTDGTPAGTIFLAALPNYSPSQPLAMVALGSTLFFPRDEDFVGTQPWMTNGTVASTRRMPWNTPDGNGMLAFLGTAGGRVIFAGRNTNQAGGASATPIWSTNGSQGGPTLLTLVPSTTSFASKPSGNELYFRALQTLYVTDGTAAGTRKAFDNVALNLLGGASTFYFLANSLGSEIWMTTGTPDSALVVEEFGAGNASISMPTTDPAFTPQGMIFFAAKTSANDWEPRIIRFDADPVIDFANQADVLTNSLIVSAPAKITGINVPLDVSVFNGEFCVSSQQNCACDLQPYELAGSVQSGEYLCARQLSSALAFDSTITQFTIGSVSRMFISVTRDASPMSAGFASSSYTVAENGSVVVAVVRQGAEGALNVNFSTVNGTAAAGVDFGTPGSGAQVSGTLSWADGDFSPRNIVVGSVFGSFVPIINDGTVEADKSFSISLTPTSPGASASPAIATIKIVDDDNVSTIGFSTTSLSLGENSADNYLFVTRSGKVDTTASVSWTTQDGTAVAGSDFGTAGSNAQRSGTIVFFPNETQRAIRIGSSLASQVPILDDGVGEPDETFSVRLSSPNGAVLNANTVANVTILGVNTAVAMASAAQSVLEKDGEVVITVNRTGSDIGSPVTVQYGTVAGTAVAGVDFTAVSGSLFWAGLDTSPKTITVPIIDNDVFAGGSKSFQVKLLSSAEAIVGTPSATTVTVVDDDATVQFSAATVSVKEGTPNLTLTVTKSGVVPQAVSVNWHTGDASAVAGRDFGPPTSGTITWQAGETGTRQIVIPIANNAMPEADKSFTVTLAPPANARLGTNSTSIVTILEDDPGITLVEPERVVGEGKGSVQLSVARVGPVSLPASVRWAAANATATAGSDFGTRGSSTPPTGIVSWIAGDAQPKTITIPILQDTLSEGDETFTVTLSTPSFGIKLGSLVTTTVTILEDDIPLESSVSFPQAKVVVVEGTPTAEVAVHRESVGAGFTTGLTVSYTTVAGTALATTDFTAKTGTLTWASDDSSDKKIAIPIVDNAVAESAKAFKVRISTASPGAQVTTPEATVTILDDDEAFPPHGAIPDDWTVPGGAAGGFHVSNEAGAYEGVFSLRSDAIQGGESAQIETTRTFAAGTVAFRVKLSSEPNFDVLRFYVDDVVKGSWSGTTIAGWQLFSMPITAGAHTLRWSYEKDASASMGADAAWIDGVVLP